MLLEAINQQIKMLQGVVTILCTQKEEEPKDLVKVQLLIVINDSKSRELQSRVDWYIEELKKPKAIPQSKPLPSKQRSFVAFVQRVVDTK